MASTLRRATCRVTLNNGLQYLDLARALYTQVSPDSVHAIQPLSKVLYQVTFKNDKFFKKAMDNGLVHISGEDFEFVPVDGLTRWINVRDVPIWVEQAAFTAAFTPYGQILQYQEEEWSQLPGVKNGNRKIQIKMLVQNGVPNILKVGQGHRARVFYPGVEFLCFKCKEKGHKFAECPQRVRSEIPVQQPNSTADNPEVPPAVTQEPSEHIQAPLSPNPATEVIPSPETPPAKPQKRRWVDPLEDPENPNYSNAPTSDILPAGTFGNPFAGSIDDLSLAALESIINGTMTNPNMDYDEDADDSDNDTTNSTKLRDLIKEHISLNSNRPPSSPAKRRSSPSPKQKQTPTWKKSK